MTLARVSRWRKKLIDSGASTITVAKAYRLPRAVFNTAVDDKMIKGNACRIKGAGNEDSPERPVPTVAEVYALAGAVGLRYRSLILLAAFTSRVTRQLYHHDKGYKFGPPKSKAGVRTVPFPELIVSDLRNHLQWVPFPVSLVFCSSTGTPLSHSNFRRRVWLPAPAAVGLEGVHIHDLRHTGNQLTADAGADPKELIARMGHDSERAAVIYLHSSA